MKLGRLLFILPVSLISLIAATSCSPKTTPSGEPNVSVTGDVPAEIPPSQTEFSWMTYDRKIRRIEDVRQNIEKTMKEYGITGLSLIIKQKKWPQNTESFLLNIGAENSGLDKTIDSGTVFRADHLGQTIMAYIALQFATYRQFDIDKPLIDYLPESSYRDSPFRALLNDARLKRLTARTILSHQSGLRDSKNTIPVESGTFINTPGKEFGYSEDAFELLRYVLENRFKLDINQIAKRLVFDPFKMNRSSFVMEPRFEGHLAAIKEAEMDLKKPPSVPRTKFYTNAIDYMAFMWLLRTANPWLAHEWYSSHLIYPTVSIRSSSLHGPSLTGKRPDIPPQLAWCLGWGIYQIPKVELGICNFIGQKGSGVESYATIYESRNSTALAVFIVTDKPKSFMPIVIEELLGKIDTPLAWLGFN